MTLKPRPSDSELRAIAEARRMNYAESQQPQDRARIYAQPLKAFAPELGPDSPLRGKPKRTTRDDPEHREQVRLFVWIDTEQEDEAIKQAYAVPNGGKRGPLTAKKMKAEGVRPGECDINLDVARGQWHGLRIELKVGSGRLTPAQELRVAEHLANGYFAAVCIGWEAARDLLRDYAALGDFGPTEA